MNFKWILNRIWSKATLNINVVIITSITIFVEMSFLIAWILEDSTTYIVLVYNCNYFSRGVWCDMLKWNFKNWILSFILNMIWYYISYYTYHGTWRNIYLDWGFDPISHIIIFGMLNQTSFRLLNIFISVMYNIGRFTFLNFGDLIGIVGLVGISSI